MKSLVDSGYGGLTNVDSDQVIGDRWKGAVAMSVVCPGGVARAPKTAVWALLTQPQLYPRWMDARPADEWERPIRTHDMISLRVKGTPLKMTWNVLDADTRTGRLHLGIQLPPGVFNDETISVIARSEDETLIRFY